MENKDVSCKWHPGLNLNSAYAHVHIIHIACWEFFSVLVSHKPLYKVSCRISHSWRSCDCAPKSEIFNFEFWIFHQDFTYIAIYFFFDKTGVFKWTYHIRPLSYTNLTLPTNSRV